MDIVKNNLPKLITIYFFLLGIYCFSIRHFTFRYSEILLLASVVWVLGYHLYENKKYIISTVVTFSIYLSIVPLKLNIYEYVDLYDVSRFIAFTVATVCLFTVIVARIKSARLSKFVIYTGVVLFLLPVFFVWAYYLASGAWISADTVVALLQTNLAEISEYLIDVGLDKCIVIFSALALLTYLLTYLLTCQDYIFKLYNTKLVISFFLLSFFLLYKCSNNLLTSIIYDTRNYIKSYEAFVQSQEERKNNIKNSIGNFENNGDGVYIVVLGESQLRDNMSAYGYHRKTTPWLEKFILNKNAVLFDKAYSCHAYTTVSLAYALTAKNQYNELDVKKALSILEVANIAGYDTVWMSNQTKYSLADNPVTVIASSAKQQIWTNTSTDTCYTVFYDGKLLERFKDIKFSKNMLIIVHLMGNHVGYDERYPKEFAIFGDKEIADKYDNSLFYNDYLMGELTSAVSEIPNFKAMLYVSDHGEDIRHGLRHDVNRFTFDMTRIPMYMYFSDSYIQEQKIKYDYAVKNRVLPFTNDLVFDTVLSLMNIKVEDFYDIKNDILSEKYDGNEKRFKTLYGKKLIMEDENWIK